MRLIDAEALKQLVDEEWFDCQEKLSFFDEIDRTPTIDEYDVVAEYCQKRCLDIVTGDFLDKLKHEYARVRNATPVLLYPDAPVMHGKWINYTEPDADNNRRCDCSVCGAGDIQAVGVDVPYCWKCGAKMERSEE